MVCNLLQCHLAGGWWEGRFSAWRLRGVLLPMACAWRGTWSFVSPSSMRLRLRSVGKVVSVGRLCNILVVLCVEGPS